MNYLYMMEGKLCEVFVYMLVGKLCEVFVYAGR